MGLSDHTEPIGDIVFKPTEESGDKYTLYYTSVMENEFFIPFFEKLTVIMSQNANNTCDIYIASNGGFSYCSDTLIHFINQHKERIRLIVCAGMQSAGFDIFYYSKCKIELLPFAYGVVHKGLINSDDREMATNKNKKAFLEQLLNEQNDKALRDFKWFLTPKEIKGFEDYEDIYISRKKMQQILNERKTK